MKAFPVFYFDLPERMEGMDLRDYFAAKALPEVMRIWHSNDPDTDYIYKLSMAEIAYEMADAMMKARKQEDES